MSAFINRLNGNAEHNYIVESSLKKYSANYLAQNFSIKYVSKGVETYTIDGRKYDLSEQNFLVVNPGQNISIDVDDSSDVIGRCYFFDPGLIAQMHHAQRKTPDKNLGNPEVSQYCEAFGNVPVNAYGTGFHTLLNAFSACNLESENEISDFLILLAENLVAYQNNIHTQLDQLESSKKITRLELYKRIQVGRQYIHDNYRETVSLSGIAKAAGLSEYYYHRNFRKYLKCTPHQYLNMVRMNAAHRLFEEGTNTITEIAFQCGFSDPKYFRKVYKKWKCLLS